MKVTEKIIQIDSAWFSPERDEKRSKGLHLSGVIDFIEWQEGKREKSTGKISEIGNNYAGCGFAWETLLERLIEYNPTELWEWMFSRAVAEPNNPRTIRPGEQYLEAGPCPKCDSTGRVVIDIPRANLGRIIGKEKTAECRYCAGTGILRIYMTPDKYHIDDQVLEEWKWTTKSSNSQLPGPKFTRWTDYQIPVYLKALDLLVCRLRVCFARGNYADKPAPVWKEFMLEYTPEEIDETWESVELNAQAMVAGGY